MTKKKQSRGEAPARLETQLCFAIYGAAHALTRTYKPLLEPLGLTYPQYLVMLVLWEEDDQSVRAIGDRLGLDSGTLSPLLKRLEQGGLVSRKRDSQDERLVRISLTQKGQDLASQAIDVTRAIAEATQCSLEEMEGLRDRVRALTGRLQEQQPT
ncbi:MarR family transcriptional regulator [Pseudorhizobium halotolerans]|uniref:MarR family transcriptional regulator n=1 Tax=Pseudorhizobium halotolerans TaxID=1233081 RepID=A0ABM8PS25_9HYPH|nr:MarR family transcriptional regulator [Pseudorhizobium halotolerans]CAD7045315.1 MarR family transcriptional regulator [Pseudorhizobium halotolerans]